MDISFDDASISRIKDRLISRKQTLAVAESVTTGFLQAALASAENAIAFFDGGITAYNIDQKVKHLSIDRRVGQACNCVSAEIATQMARGVIRLFGSDWGIAVTGYATPVEESGFKLFAYYSVCYKDAILDTQRIDLADGKRENVQMQYVNRILRSISAAIEKQQ